MRSMSIASVAFNDMTILDSILPSGVHPFVSQRRNNRIRIIKTPPALRRQANPLFYPLDSISFFSSPTEVPAVWIRAQWPRAYRKRF
jgi:hypothetical protein